MFKTKQQITLSPILLGVFILASACGSQQKSVGSSKQIGVARMQVNEPIPGVCDNENVIVVLPIPGNMQVKAVAPKSEDVLTQELNDRVPFLKDHPDFEGQGIVQLIINCKGDLVRCQIDNKTTSAELDSQIVAVFADLKKWKPGTFANKPIDTVELYSFTIKNGKITL